MKIHKYKGNALCFCCKNKFDKGFEFDFDKRFFNNIKFCQKCCQLLYEQLGKEIIPKSPKNIFSDYKIIDKG